MIFCGYAGVGKSTAASKFVRVVDLESTPFQKDWETYARVAKHMSDQGYIVLVSSLNITLTINLFLILLRINNHIFCPNPVKLLTEFLMTRN